jgi:hypothetical protein
VEPEQTRFPKLLQVLGGNRRRLVGLLGSREQHVVRDRAGSFHGLGERWRRGRSHSSVVD